MFQIPSEKKYNEKLKSKAYTRLAMRIAVAGYIFYLAWAIASGSVNGKSTRPLWCGILFCGLFVIGAVFFAVYSARSFFKALRAAEIGNGSDTSDKEEQ